MSVVCEPETVEVSKVEKLLLKGLGRINGGWTQGRYKNWQTGEYCAAGAILQDSEGGIDEAWEALVVEIPASSHTTYNNNCLITYNDTPGRTKQEIVELYERAIRNVRSK